MYSRFLNLLPFSSLYGFSRPELCNKLNSMIFAANGAMRPFNGRAAGLLETKLQGFLELGYKAHLYSDLRGSLTYELLGSH